MASSTWCSIRYRTAASTARWRRWTWAFPSSPCAGAATASARSYSILANLGVLDTVAHNPSEYVAIAARLADDRTFRAQVRAAIRAGLARSPLTDMDAHTRNLERAYLTALERRYPAALAGSA